MVVDIGGWACPFNRANDVVDSEPYESRGFYATIGLPASQAGSGEHFTKDTWMRRDICDCTPLPFADKSVDFVICSHTLEDVRDPLQVCREMIRIAKAGYVEVPSRAAESSRGWELPNMAGHTEPATLPGYFAQARFRFTRTLEIAKSLGAQSILEIGAGAGFNGICLPDRTGRFDLVMASEVIEHVAHGDRVVRHLRSFLHPGGHLLLTTPNGAYFRSRLPTFSQIEDRSAVESRQFKPDADGHLYLYTPEELNGLLTREGFRDIHTELSITPWISGNGGTQMITVAVRAEAN